MQCCWLRPISSATHWCAALQYTLIAIQYFFLAIIPQFVSFHTPKSSICRTSWLYSSVYVNFFPSISFTTLFHGFNLAAVKSENLICSTCADHETNTFLHMCCARITTRCLVWIAHYFEFTKLFRYLFYLPHSYEWNAKLDHKSLLCLQTRLFDYFFH